LDPAVTEVDAPEKALHAASLVGEKKDEADAVNASPPLVNVSPDMNGEGGNCTPELPMKKPALARHTVKSLFGCVLLGQFSRLIATSPSADMYPLAYPVGTGPNMAVSQLE
jgi:hypothetical protein